ncbi:MAG: protein kinase [Candidatus Nanopelagicales bacterium]|nr:protein kinase [Candidatus Nanopelagicales bacterium]
MSGANDRIFDGRYALDVQVASSLSSPIWRAMDLSLKRWVNLILLPTSDLRSVKLLQECQLAAVNDRRDVVSILDVIPDGKISSANDSASHDRYVGIVTEWLDGETLDRLIVRRGEVLPIEQALRQLGTITNTLMHAHSLNVFHRRLRPHNVIFSPGQEVRLAGFGVDSALLGPDSNDGVAQDIKGVGQLLFVMITGMWPLGSVDSLPAALSDGGAGLVLPSQVHGGVRPYIDQMYKRTQDGTFTSMRQVLDALSVGEVEESESLQNRVSRLTASSVTWTPPQSAGSSKIRSTLIAGLSVLVFGWFGWQLLTSNFYRSDSDIAVLTSPLPSMEISQATGELAKIAAVTIYDPLGDDAENSEQALLAIDGDKESAWTTVNYRQADMSGKAGVGLVLDLGSAQDVYAVEVDFTSIGHSAEIYVANSTEPDFVTTPKFGDVNPAESSSSVAVSNPVSGRYVLIWLTPDLPKSDTNEFQGGVSEVRVRL